MRVCGEEYVDKVLRSVCLFQLMHGGMHELSYVCNYVVNFLI